MTTNATQIVTIGRGHYTHLSDGREFPDGMTLCGRYWTDEAEPFQRVGCRTCRRKGDALGMTTNGHLPVDPESSTVAAPTPSNDPRNVREWDDESLDWGARFLDGFAAVALKDPIRNELARRAEIRLNRRADVEYGPNPYGFTADEISAPHDAAWYEPRQTVEQFFDEMGYDVHDAECEGSHVPECPIGRAERDEANRRAAGAQAKWDAANGRPPRNGYGFSA